MWAGGGVGTRSQVPFRPAALLSRVDALLGSPVVAFYPFSFWVPLLKPNSRKKGTLIIKGLQGNLDYYLIVPTKNDFPEAQKFGIGLYGL